jgi:superfamily II DNA or RNA helicase
LDKAGDAASTQSLSGQTEGPVMRKLADLLPDVALQEHQQRLSEEAEKAPLRKLLVHALGSGKTLTAIAAAERRGDPYTAITPAAVRPTFKGEQQKFTTGGLPSDVMSYSQLALGNQPKHTDTLVFDEAHRLRNPKAQSTQNAMAAARQAKQLLMLSGTPIVNEPSDLAVPMSMLTGKNITPKEFTKRYVEETPRGTGILSRLTGEKPRMEIGVARRDELKKLLQGHVDWHQPDKPVVPIQREDIHVEMGPEQSRLYRAMWNKLPFYLRWKLQHDYPVTSSELQRAQTFLTGPRQVSLSPYTFMGKDTDPLAAFGQSTKLQRAHEELSKHLKDPRSKALIFSNFIDAGLTPYAAKLKESGIPHAVFHGGLNDRDRKQLVDDYNVGKIRAALIGPSGTEGLSFKGTQLIQQLDPYWNPIRGRQAEGRGLRFDSHTGLPEDLQNVKIQRYVSRQPLGWGSSLLHNIGFDQSGQQKATDDYLQSLENRKQDLNQKFMDLLKEVGTPQQKTAATAIRRFAAANPERVPGLIEKGLLPDKYQLAQQQKAPVSWEQFFKDNPYVGGIHPAFVPSYQRVAAQMPPEHLPSRVLAAGGEQLAIQTRGGNVAKFAPGSYAQFPEFQGNRPHDMPTLGRWEAPANPAVTGAGQHPARAAVQPQAQLSPQGHGVVLENAAMAKRIEGAGGIHTDLAYSPSRQTGIYQGKRYAIDPGTMIGGGAKPTWRERLSNWVGQTSNLPSVRANKLFQLGGMKRIDTPHTATRMEAPLFTPHTPKPILQPAMA